MPCGPSPAGSGPLKSTAVARSRLPCPSPGTASQAVPGLGRWRGGGGCPPLGVTALRGAWRLELPGETAPLVAPQSRLYNQGGGCSPGTSCHSRVPPGGMLGTAGAGRELRVGAMQGAGHGGRAGARGRLWPKAGERQRRGARRTEGFSGQEAGSPMGPPCSVAPLERPESQGLPRGPRWAGRLSWPRSPHGSVAGAPTVGPLGSEQLVLTVHPPGPPVLSLPAASRGCSCSCPRTIVTRLRSTMCGRRLAEAPGQGHTCSFPSRVRRPARPPPHAA